MLKFLINLNMEIQYTKGPLFSSENRTFSGFFQGVRIRTRNAGDHLRRLRGMKSSISASSSAAGMKSHQLP